MRLIGLPEKQLAREIAADIARELRKHPECWTTGCFARDSNGCRVHYRDPYATCWCLEGHIYKRHGDIVHFAILAGTLDDCTTGLATFNDASSTSIDDVIALCEKVAQSCMT